MFTRRRSDDPAAQHDEVLEQRYLRGPIEWVDDQLRAQGLDHVPVLEAVLAMRARQQQDDRGRRRRRSAVMSAAAAILTGVLLLTMNGERRRDASIVVVDGPVAATTAHAPLLLARAMDPPAATPGAPHPRGDMPSAASPDVDRAVADADEQSSAGGFTAQTWDITGNEANFFVRDVTGGSRLPFRVRPGAPTAPVDICTTDADPHAPAPAATRLLPNFAVAGPTAGAATFTITNTSDASQVAHVAMWADATTPMLDFNVFLTGYDVQSIEFYDVIRGTPSAEAPRVAAAGHEGELRLIVLSACSTGASASSEVRFDNVLVGDYQQVEASAAGRTPLVNVLHLATHGTADPSSGEFRVISFEPSPIDGAASCATHMPARNWVIVSTAPTREGAEPEIISARYEVRCVLPLVCTPSDESRRPP